MNGILTAAAALAVAFADYPGALSRNAPIEAAIDRGLIVELVVRCGNQVGMLTFSKVEKQFCDPAMLCHRRFADARNATCRGR